MVACSSNSPTIISEIDLTILHTNDHHGHYWPDLDKGRWGGMPARKTLVDSIRKEVKSQNGYSLLLSGGDINTGTLESDIYNAKPDFLGMKKIGYDAMALGNHEFDNDLQVLKQQIKWANFPIISANIYVRKTDKRFVRPYILKEFNGIKIGIIGLTTTDTPQKASSEDARKYLDFKNVISETQKIVMEMKSQDIDAIIAVTHMGHKGSATADGDIKLANAVEDIDVIVGGHSQQKVLAEKHGNAIVVQAEEWGKYLGRLDLKITKTNLGTSVEMSKPYKLIPINLKQKISDKTYRLLEKEIPEDKELKEFLAPYYLSAKNKAKKVVAYSEADIPFTSLDIRSKPTALGQFVGEAMRRQTKSDLAIINGGGIRTGLEKGNIELGMIHNIHPYGNTIANVTLTPEELYEYINFSLSFYHAANNPNRIDLGGGYPHYAGIQLVIHNKELIKIKANDDSWTITKKPNGKITSTGKKQIILSISSFQSIGGDGYTDFSNRPSYSDSGFSINKAVEESLIALPKKQTSNGILPILSKEEIDRYQQLARESIVDNLIR